MPDYGLTRELLAFLQRTYVQRQDARQKEMGLIYMEAETHGLAADLANWFEERQRRLGQ